MIHYPESGSCCNDCRNAVMIQKLTDKLGAMALRTVDLEAALRGLVGKCAYCHRNPTADDCGNCGLARKVLGDK